MALELFYTSAPRGLKPQTTGFCTVGMSRGFPPPFVPRLEALSGYRPPHEEASIEASPTAWSHWIVDAGGVERHVLSAVGATAPDHTLRNNKFAHHLLLRADELIEAGPAWLLAQPGVMANQWIGEPRLIDAERLMPTASASTIERCDSWERVCGDAGWAGVIANVVMIDPSKSCSIVYPVGAPVLKLVAEALALLPSNWRWRVTFTTYFMQPMAGTRCAWRFCLDGTEAAAAARASGATLVDLCARHHCTQTGTFIDRARGRERAPQHSSSSSRGGSSVSHARAAATAPGATVPAATVPGATPPPPPPRLPTRRALPESARREPEVIFGFEDVPDRQGDVRKIVVWVAGIAAALLALLTAAGVFYWYSMRPPSIVSPAPANTISPPTVAPLTLAPSDSAPRLMPMRTPDPSVEVAEPQLPAVANKSPQQEPPPPPAHIQITSVVESTANAESAPTSMPSTVDAWKVIEIPGQGKQMDGSWAGSETIQFGAATSAQQIQSIEWAVTPEKLVGDFEFPDAHSLAQRGRSGAARTIATIASDGSQARFSWRADAGTVRSDSKLFTHATTALKQVPLVVSFVDGSSLWCTTEKIASIDVGDMPTPVPIAVASAPWQYSVRGQEWIAWTDSTERDLVIAVVIDAPGGEVEVGGVSLVRKGTKCTAKFQLNAASDPVALRQSIERALTKWRDAKAELAAAADDHTTKGPERVVNARTAEIAAKESLAAARQVYESRRASVALLGGWEALVGSAQGVPARITIRALRFARLKEATP